MTIPSKTWVLRRLPSMTWKCTRTRSPGSKRGTRFSCRCSMLSMIVLMVRRLRGAGIGETPKGPEKARDLVWPAPGSDSRQLAAARALNRSVGQRSARPGALAAALTPPCPHLGVVAGEQHRGDLPAPVARRPGVVRVLGQAAERGRERFLHRALGMAQGPREFAQDGIGDHH